MHRDRRPLDKPADGTETPPSVPRINYELRSYLGHQEVIPGTTAFANFGKEEENGRKGAIRHFSTSQYHVPFTSVKLSDAHFAHLSQSKLST